MKRAARFLPLTLGLICLVLLSGCCTSVSATPGTNTTTSQAVSVAIAEDSVSLGGGEGYQFVATVTGSANTAVTWSLNGCSGSACGSINSTGYYTAPSIVSSPANIQVRATSQVDPSKFDTVIVHHETIAVSVTPGDVWMSPGESKQFTASVQFDVNKAGVTWRLACNNESCGTLKNVTATSVIYTAPAEFPVPPIITLAAVSRTSEERKGRVSIAESANKSLAEGNYAFLFSGWELHFSSGYWPFRFNVAGHFRADGEGNILDGVEDISSIDGVLQSVPFTGTYIVGTDRRGALTIVTAEKSATYHMVLEPSGTRARFIRFDGTPDSPPISGAGYLELQDSTAFSLSALKGDYAMGVSGAGAGNDWDRITAAGRFTVDPEGVLGFGQMDRARQILGGIKPTSYSRMILSGTLGAPSTETGRGMLSITLQAEANAAEKLNFVYYAVSDDKLMLVQIDPRADETAGSVLSGEARRQQGVFSTESLKGPIIFSMAGLNREGYGGYYEHVAVGQFVADGSGSFTGVIDDNSSALTNQAFHGSFSVDSDGRSQLKFGAGNIDDAVAYLYRPNRAFFMQTIPTSDLLFGDIRPQSTATFDPSSITGTFLTVTAPPTSEESENECGLATFDGHGGATLSVDVNENLNDDPQVWRQHFELTGIYDVSANGRGTLTFPSQAVVFWIISPTEIVGNAATTSWALLELTR